MLQTAADVVVRASLFEAADSAVCNSQWRLAEDLPTVKILMMRAMRQPLHKAIQTSSSTQPAFGVAVAGACLCMFTAIQDGEVDMLTSLLPQLHMHAARRFPPRQIDHFETQHLFLLVLSEQYTNLKLSRGHAEPSLSLSWMLAFTEQQPRKQLSSHHETPNNTYQQVCTLPSIKFQPLLSLPSKTGKYPNLT